MKNLADIFSLKGKVALVTGGKRGIGGAIALTFADAGADIIVCDINDDSGEMATLASKVQEKGRRCLTFNTDISQTGQVKKMVEIIIQEFGKIDILVNNAGISPATPPIHELAENDWDRVLDINLKGTYICIKETVPHMIKQDYGNVINIASVEGLGTVRHASSPYGASKSGIVMLTRGMAWDLGKHHIRVNAIAPGYIRTEMTRGIWDTKSESYQKLAQYLMQLQNIPETDDIEGIGDQYWLRMIPLARMAVPEEIAYGALYLASEAASYVSGHTLVIDGGMLA